MLIVTSMAYGKQKLNRYYKKPPIKYGWFLESFEMVYEATHRRFQGKTFILKTFGRNSVPAEADILASCSCCHITLPQEFFFGVAFDSPQKLCLPLCLCFSFRVSNVSQNGSKFHTCLLQKIFFLMQFHRCQRGYYIKIYLLYHIMLYFVYFLDNFACI